MLAFGVGGCGRLSGGVDGVAEDLDDKRGRFVFEAGEGTEGGAAAVEPEGGDGGCEGEEDCERDGRMHGG